MAVGELVGAVQSLYGDTLRAIVRFGSAVAGEVLAGQSDTNLLIIVDAVPLTALLRCHCACASPDAQVQGRKWVPHSARHRA